MQHNEFLNNPTFSIWCCNEASPSDPRSLTALLTMCPWNREVLNELNGLAH